MPFRTFKCQICGEATEEIQGIRDESTPVCKCGGETVRDYTLEGGQTSVTGVFSKPIELYSIAMNRNEIADFSRKCPGVDVATSGPMMGVPIARTRSQKMRALKAAGFEEKN